MGCGKSSVGRKLSELLCCPFMDLDAEIEARKGCTIAKIFATAGEAEFRRLEAQTLKDILETGGRVVALGGGAVMTPECEEMVHGQTICVYLKASVDELVARLSSETAGRPLLNTVPTTSHNTSLQAEHHCHVERAERVETSALRTRILNLMAKRASTYERVAHLIIDTDGKTIDQVASEIAEKTCSIQYTHRSNQS